ncbi:MAG: protoporphyrinogen oxidase [Acidobacteriota bacterium]
MDKRVCVIGGGISGLCVAYRLKKAGIDVTLFEKGQKAGGNITTEIRDGFLYEHGPNSALASRELLGLIDELGLTDEIAKIDPNSKKRFIIRDGKLVALPSGLGDFVRGKAFSGKAKLRLLKEPLVPGNSSNGESVASFFERRLGKEVVDYAVDPFISGIYAGDPTQLSVKHAFPKLFDLEKNFGSLLKGALFSKKDKTARLPKGTPRSVTFKRGMQAMSDALAKQLGDSIRLGTAVTRIQRNGDNGYTVASDQGEEVFDAVVLSTPAGAASRLTAELDPPLSQVLGGVYYAPVSVVITGFKSEHVGTDPAGFGFLVPGSEQRKVLGSLWTSSVFENRAPDGHHIFTTFIGGSRNPALSERSGAELIVIALDELRQLMGTTGEPVLTAVKKWERAIPQYNIGYEKVIDAIEDSQKNNDGFYLCSNFYKGISVGDCVKNGIATAENVVEYLIK